jgi:hypothetical protein
MTFQEHEFGLGTSKADHCGKSASFAAAWTDSIKRDRFNKERGQFIQLVNANA